MPKRTVVTPKFRVAFPKVFSAQRNELNGKDEYSIVMLFPKDTNLKELKDLVKEAATEKWGDDQAKWPKNLRIPFRDGDKEKDNLDGYKGHYFVTARSLFKPGVVDHNVQPILDQTQFYGGCYALAEVTAYAYSNKGNNGISFGLNHVQKVAEGKPFSGRKDVKEVFTAVGGDSESDYADSADNDDFFKD